MSDPSSISSSFTPRTLLKDYMLTTHCLQLAPDELEGTSNTGLLSWDEEESYDDYEAPAVSALQTVGQ